MIRQILFILNYTLFSTFFLMEIYLKLNNKKPIEIKLNWFSMKYIIIFLTQATTSASPSSL